MDNTAKLGEDEGTARFFDVGEVGFGEVEKKTLQSIVLRSV
jgi:hypothetical protein